MFSRVLTSKGTASQLGNSSLRPSLPRYGFQRAYIWSANDLQLLPRTDVGPRHEARVNACGLAAKVGRIGSCNYTTDAFAIEPPKRLLQWVYHKVPYLTLQSTSADFHQTHAARCVLPSDRPWVPIAYCANYRTFGLVVVPATWHMVPVRLR